MKKHYTPEFKAKVVRELLHEEQSVSQLAATYGVHPNRLYQWRSLALAGLPSLFSDQASQDQAAKDRAHQEQLDQLYTEIGKLTTQLAWLKKTSPVACDIPPGEKRSRLPPGALSPTIGCCIPKTRPTNLLVCGRRSSGQNP